VAAVAAPSPVRLELEDPAVVAPVGQMLMQHPALPIPVVVVVAKEAYHLCLEQAVPVLLSSRSPILITVSSQLVLLIP
jgi:hypothetical protein